MCHNQNTQNRSIREIVGSRLEALKKYQKNLPSFLLPLLQMILWVTSSRICTHTRARAHSRTSHPVRAQKVSRWERCHLPSFTPPSSPFATAEGRRQRGGRRSANQRLDVGGFCSPVRPLHTERLLGWNLTPAIDSLQS